MLTAFDGINVRQAFQLCTIFSLISCVAAATRLFFLDSRRQYRPFLGLLIFWILVCVMALAVPVSSRLYYQIYVISVPISWLFYLFVARDLYQRIFDGYRGIAFAGRWCLYVAALLLLLSGVETYWISPARSKTSAVFATVTSIDQSVLFSLAFFLLLLVAVIVRYPISIQKNLVVHTLVFSGLLFCQAILLSADGWTSYRLSAVWNTLSQGFDALLISGWAFMMTTQGESLVVRIRHNIRPEMEIQLLSQLSTVNGILLRAARK